MLNRQLHRSHYRVRENDYSLNGLLGFDLYGKTVGIVGTGKIGRTFAHIMLGLGCRVIAYDPCPNETLQAEGVAEGRTVYGNIVKAIAFILPTNLAQAVVIVLVGWALGDGRTHPPEADPEDADALYQILEADVAPCFYQRDAGDLPAATLQSATHAYRYQGLLESHRPDADFTARVIPRHSAARIPAECQKVLWQSR